MVFRIAAVCLVFCLVDTVTAEDESLTVHTLKFAKGAKAANAELSQFSWLTGRWKGTGLGAECHEMWSAPGGNCMVGTFRMVQEGDLVFSEFFMLQESENGVVLKLKHFGKDMVGWEEKDGTVDFPLIKLEEKTAWFGGLTYQLQDDGSLKVFVAMKKKDGTFNEGRFHFQRLDSDGGTSK